MSSASSANASASNTNPNSVPSLTPVQTQKWELGVSLVLNFWQPLRDAVASSWGGPESADKRDWLCGVIADMWVERPATDEYDIEEVLVGVMDDEFEVALEDDSAFDIGKQVVALRQEIFENKFSTVELLHQRFLAMPANQQAPPKVQDVEVEAGSSADEDEDEDEDGESVGGEDVEMTDAPRSRERQEPVIDEDGFRLVQKKGRR